MHAPAGMPCMHAISAIQEKNDKRPEEYCHEWLTMEAYRRTYQFNMNPVKGQELWEKTGSPASVPPPIKPKPGRPITKRRKDKAEGPIGTKTKMKRKYTPIRCMYCRELAVVPPPQAAPGPKVENVADTQPIQTLPTVALAAPNEQTEIPVNNDDNCLMQTRGKKRSPKLHVTRARTKENASPKPIALRPIVVSAEMIKGSSSATAKKLASFMTFVPTPGFKTLRKKRHGMS
ncbi:hypothetical protein Ahy_A06g028940 [Arachis hypogaea]|uniref:Zinc finger PMZ-type domain-containing protein n=1 Tax=Arachis hypogaea TaxID=3818 RepID=A0A445CRX1_ARAHY|nr:hypothetical protein Ahy_A06g028940 [Arachis hypogaea]